MHRNLKCLSVDIEKKIIHIAILVPELTSEPFSWLCRCGTYIGLWFYKPINEISIWAANSAIINLARFTGMDGVHGHGHTQTPTRQTIIIWPLCIRMSDCMWWPVGLTTFHWLLQRNFTSALTPSLYGLRLERSIPTHFSPARILFGACIWKWN